MISAELVAAVAASAAAALSAVTLVLTSRQAERKYRREALVDTMMQVMNASFGGIINATYRARAAGNDMGPHKVKAIKAHDAEIQALTRLRLLASKSVVQRATELHDVEDQMWTVIFHDDPLLSEEEWNRLRLRRQKAQNALFKAARRNLGLGRANPITDPSEVLGPVDADRKEIAAIEAGHRVLQVADSSPPDPAPTTNSAAAIPDTP